MDYHFTNCLLFGSFELKCDFSSANNTETSANAKRCKEAARLFIQIRSSEFVRWPQDLHKLVQERKYKKAVSRTKFQESLASVTQKKKDISSVNCKNHPTRYDICMADIKAWTTASSFNQLKKTSTAGLVAGPWNTVFFLTLIFSAFRSGHLCS